MIEYVEEYIDDINDEDTNDGFENEDEIVKEEPEPLEAVSQFSEITEQEVSTSTTSFIKRKDSHNRIYRSSHLKLAVEESDDGKSPDGSQLQLHQCDFCGKISVSREEHETHQAEHEGEQRFKCKKCDAKFTSKSDARDHLTSAHSNDDKMFNCETCSKGFKNRYQLILHHRSHTGEKPFECAICNRCFSMSSNLQKHLVSILTTSCAIVPTLYERSLISGHTLDGETLHVHGLQSVLQDAALVEVPHGLLSSAGSQSEMSIVRQKLRQQILLEDAHALPHRFVDLSHVTILGF